MLPSAATVNARLQLRCGVLAGLLVAALVATAGCHRNPPPSPTLPAPLPADLAAARDTVINYLTVLDHGDYERAFSMLTHESRTKMTLTEFSAAGKAGKTDYAEDKVQVERIDAAHALVSMQLYEDPAVHGFRLTLANGAWQIEMVSGTPYSPEGQP